MAHEQSRRMISMDAAEHERMQLRIRELEATVAARTAERDAIAEDYELVRSQLRAQCSHERCFRLIAIRQAAIVHAS